MRTRMGKVMRVLLHLVMAATRLVVYCEERNIEFLHTRNVSGSAQMLFNPKSHIEKFADSWRFYAKANDIAKREMLKMALRDALHSIEKPEKHSLITNRKRPQGPHNEASNLLKEFNQMYTLSDAVKRTLGAYQQAKKRLYVKNNVNPENNNKRDVIPEYRTEKDVIPQHDVEKDVIAERDVEKDVIPTYKRTLAHPVILKRTSKISVKANPLNNGGIGIEYTSVDPRYSNIAQAEKAVRAARIILAYSGGRKKSVTSETKDEDEDEEMRKSALPAPRRHWVGKGLSKIVRDRDATAVTGTGRSGVSSVVESLAEGDDLPEEDKAAIESLDTKDLVPKVDIESPSTPKVVSKKEVVKKIVKKEVVNQYVGQLRRLYERYLKLKEENDTVENALQFQAEIINSNLGNVSKDMLGNLTFISTKEIVENAVNKSKEEDIKDEAVRPVVKSIDDDVSTATKQEDTLKELKEARLAKQRYEIAKQELAHKIKELYILANNYEKDETENQILEVKNMISHTPHDKDDIPGQHGVPTPEFVSAAQNITARDDTHPGYAKSAVPSKTTGEHKGASMGAVDANAKTKNGTKKQYEYLQLPNKPKGKSDSEKAKNDDETLNIIAQALKEDMKNASKIDAKDSKKDDKKGEDSKIDSILESKLEENKGLTEDTSDKHNDTSVTKEVEKDSSEVKSDKSAEGGGNGTTTGGEEKKEEKKDMEHDGGITLKEEHNETTVTDDKHKQVNIMKDIKDDLESKHALPQHYNESVDEYLTKALQEIISADSSNAIHDPTATAEPTATEHNDLAAPHDPANAATPNTNTPNPSAASWPEENDIDENSVNPSEHNKNVVENAMKQHARNPNLPLPLVDTKGDKIKLNPAISNATVIDSAGGGEAAAAQGPTTPPTPTATSTTTTTTQSIPSAASALTPSHESMQPLAATKPEPKPIQQPTAVLLHATEKNVSTALPDLDLHDPENKQLLDKASHMEESIAVAQDKLYNEAETKLGVSDVETHSKGASPVEMPAKEIAKENKDEMFSKNTLETSPDMKPVASSFAPMSPMSQLYPYNHDPYGSINEKVQGVERIATDPEIDEGADEEDDAEPALHHHRHHHHHHHHRRHHHRDPEEEDAPDADEEDADEEEDAPEEEEEEDPDDDDDDDKDKKSKIKYVGKKRGFNTTGSKTARTISLPSPGSYPGPSSPFDPEDCNVTQMVQDIKDVCTKLNPKLNTTSGSASTPSDEDADDEDPHIDELEDNKRSGIPKSNPKKKFQVAKRKTNKAKQAHQVNKKIVIKGMKIMKGKTKRVKA